MTIPEFLEQLKTKATWTTWRLERIMRTGQTAYVLRCGTTAHGPFQCPLAFVGRVPLWKALQAGTQLGLSEADSIALISAADENFGYDPALRTQLLAAVRMASVNPLA